MELSFITRGNSSIYGKSRVFLLVHPDDFHLYFKSITNDIFKFHNCSIWYPDIGCADTDIDFELDEMQLFVLLISHNLLSDTSTYLEEIIAFALENRIPVLPIAVEPGIEKMFTEKCGDLEFIDRFSVDPTAKPYEERLREFLDRTLLNDDQIAQIRAAFDAYIFLSYRKKDRAYAQKLMRLIHENDFCEKVAIWYDEFLRPGESFNEAIEKALIKSDLFSMVITPNTAGEKNYIIDVEYPLARQYCKTILPIEMVESDIIQLKETFPDIPSPIDHSNSEELIATLRNYIPFASEISKHDIVHSFFVGLAYLSGIYVEVDRDRALKLISQAAKGRLEQAMKKLADMYYVGDGVNVDIATAIEWQSALVSDLSDKAESNFNEENAITYLRENIRLGEMYFINENYPLADYHLTQSYYLSRQFMMGTVGITISGKIKSFLKRLKQSGNDFFEESCIYLIRSCRMLAHIAAENDNDASEWNNNALAACVALKNTHNQYILSEIFSICSMMSDEILLSGNAAGSDRWLTIASDCWNSLDTETLSFEPRYAYSFVLDIHSQYHATLENCSDAFKYQEKREQLLQSLLNEFPENKQVQYDLINCILRKSDINAARGDSDAACALLKIAADHIQNEIQKYDNTAVKQLKADLLLAAANMEINNSNYNTAIELLKESYEIQRSATEGLSDSKHRYNSAKISETLGDCFYNLSSYDEAKAWYQQAVSDLSEILASINLFRRLAKLYEQLLYIALKQEDALAIVEWNEKALWMRNVLANGLKHGREKKNIYAPEDIQAQKNLKIIQPEILARIVAFTPKDSTLFNYVSENSHNMIINLKKFAKMVDDFRNAHSFIDIHGDLLSLSYKLEHVDNILNSCADDDIDFYRHIDKIQKYLFNNLSPYLWYDEEGMLILAFCGYLFICMTEGFIGGKDKAISNFNEFFDDIIFWKYPIDTINHKELWCQLYHWIK